MKPLPASHSFLILLLLLTSCFTIQAQVHFRSYTPGCYYDHSGVKHTGFIDFGHNLLGAAKINFKGDSINAENQHIDLSAITSLVLTYPADTANATRGGSNLPAPKMITDSFVVVHEVIIVPAEEESPETTTTVVRLCKFVTGAVNAKIYSREIKKSVGGVGMGVGHLGALSLAAGASMSYTDLLYLCEVDGKTVALERSNFKKILVPAFADYPELAQQIQNKQLKFGNLNEIITLYVAHKHS